MQLDRHEEIRKRSDDEVKCEMEHYITEIKINEVRHLKDITIKVGDEVRRHLILTGRNGSGKTSLLREISTDLYTINSDRKESVENWKKTLNRWQQKKETAVTEKEKLECENEERRYKDVLRAYETGVEIKYTDSSELSALYMHGKFITAFYSADRLADIEKPFGVEKITLKESASINEDVSSKLLKYMVHLQTQLAYAEQEKRDRDSENLKKWFSRFENALKKLFDDDSLRLVYNPREYNFMIMQDGHNSFGFDGLSDGYSAVIKILSDLILRMDQNWLNESEVSEYNKEGIVLIDELETHLHIELQRKILPFLISFFPRIQFVVSTHSPYILSSVSNAVVYDLERKVLLENMSDYSADDIAEGYFEAERYSVELEKKINRYRELIEKTDITEDERAERARIRLLLNNVPGQLAVDIRNEFTDLENRRRVIGQV